MTCDSTLAGVLGGAQRQLTKIKISSVIYAQICSLWYKTSKFHRSCQIILIKNFVCGGETSVTGDRATLVMPSNHAYFASVLWYCCWWRQLQGHVASRLRWSTWNHAINKFFHCRPASSSLVHISNFIPSSSHAQSGPVLNLKWVSPADWPRYYVT